MSSLLQNMSGAMRSDFFQGLANAGGTFMGQYAGTRPVIELSRMAQLQAREAEEGGLTPAEQQELAGLMERATLNTAQLGTIIASEFGPDGISQAAEILRRGGAAFAAGGAPVGGDSEDSVFSRVLSASGNALNVVVQNLNDFLGGNDLPSTTPPTPPESNN